MRWWWGGHEPKEEGHDVNGQGADQKKKWKRAVSIGFYLPARSIINGCLGIHSQVGQIAAAYTGRGRTGLSDYS